MPSRPNHAEWDEQPTEVIPPVGRHRAANDQGREQLEWLLAGGDRTSEEGGCERGTPAGDPDAGADAEGRASRRSWHRDGPSRPDVRRWLAAGRARRRRGPDGAGRSGWRQWLAASRSHWLVAAAVLGVLVLAYLLDLLAAQGEIPRGVRVAGVQIGGMTEPAARQTLIDSVSPDLRRDVPIEAGAVRTTLAPANAGLAVDWDETVAEAAGQPLNPVTRLTSLFASRDLSLRSQVDPTRLGDALDGIDTLVRKEPVDGGVRFAGTTPTVIPPSPGVRLDISGAQAEIVRDWTTGQPVRLPTVAVEPPGRVTEAAITTAITEVANPAVAAPVRVIGNGKDATLSPETIAQGLTFAPDGAGGLKPVLDVPRLTDAVRPQLASTERPPKDAAVSLVAGAAIVRPSGNGYGVDYPATFAGLVEVLKRPVGRELTALYTDQPAKLTTDRVNALGIKGVISTFTTGGFAVDSGENIKRAAQAINGKIVMPGETFSLNDATGPREAPQGYVPAGIISDGHPARGIGGGVSQLATTLYNAAYFAGMTDVAHTEHSYYISRYPVAREATVFEGAIDLKFRNDLPTGVLIETSWTPADITVRFWGTKRYEVTSATSPRSNLVPPPTLNMPPGEPCTPSTGGPGFTAADTRTMKDVVTGEVKTSTHTVHYKPSPTVVCGGGPDGNSGPN